MAILSLEEAKERGKRLAGAWDEEKYPDDEWMALCDNWDINLWSDEINGKEWNMASIYPVTHNKKGGYDETDYSTFYSVWKKEVEETP